MTFVYALPHRNSTSRPKNLEIVLQEIHPERPPSHSGLAASKRRVGQRVRNGPGRLSAGATAIQRSRHQFRVSVIAADQN